MEKSKKEGYIAGFVCILASAIFIILAVNTGFNVISGQVIFVFGAVFGALGAGSFWKPDSIGEIASEILKNYGNNMEKQKRHSKKENVKQVIIVNGSKNNINNLNKSRIK
ncbi:MAG: hypothetical protein WA130_03465 [Candidatus Methanoperedens sp.]